MAVNAVVKVVTVSMDEVVRFYYDVHRYLSSPAIVYKWEDNSSNVIPNLGIITVMPTITAKEKHKCLTLR